MNMEQLTKSQIVLLTLLVSFVTSIATGIVTVSLVQQAPPVVTQSVSRVIQETVQAVSNPSGSQHAAAAVTQEKTVVVNESDLVANAIAKASPSLVRVYTSGDTQTFIGLGVVLNAQGLMAVDSSSLGDLADAVAVLGDGTSVRAFVNRRDSGSGIAYLTAATSTVQAAPAWRPIVLSNNTPVLGESVVALTGKTSTRIASGIISSLIPTSSASSSPQVIDTQLGSVNLLSGSPLIDTQGALIGLSTGLSQADASSGFISASAIVAAVSGQ